MTPEQVFTQFPEAEVLFKAGNSEYFLAEDAADDYCGHFKVKKEKLLRSSFFGEVDAKEDSEEPKSEKKPTKAQLKAKEEADAKAAAELKAKEEVQGEPAIKEVLDLLQNAENDAQEAAKTE